MNARKNLSNGLKQNQIKTGIREAKELIINELLRRIGSNTSKIIKATISMQIFRNWSNLIAHITVPQKINNNTILMHGFPRSLST